MLTKLQQIIALHDDTAKQITATPAAWMSFLNTVAINYKYSFDDQLLICVP